MITLSKSLINVIIVTILFVVAWFVRSKDNMYFKMRERIQKYISKNDVVIDLGCGDCCLVDVGRAVIPVDVVDKSTCNNKPHIYDGHDLSFMKTVNADVVLLKFVLHHVPHYENIIQQLSQYDRKLRVIVIEDTPENGLDRMFNRIHSTSSWGTCEKCFLTKTDWIALFVKHGFRLSYHEDISRFEFPFARCPWFYPVKKSFLVFDSN